MPTTTTRPGDWTPERTARLARALLPQVFPERAAPAPAPANVVMLDSRRPAPPCPD
jgi:hypothetical protein